MARGDNVCGFIVGFILLVCGIVIGVQTPVMGSDLTNYGRGDAASILLTVFGAIICYTICSKGCN